MLDSMGKGHFKQHLDSPAIIDLVYSKTLRKYSAKVQDMLRTTHLHVNENDIGFAKLQERRAPHSIWAKHGVGD